jgi:hypothetical protein
MTETGCPFATTTAADPGLGNSAGYSPQDVA